MKECPSGFIWQGHKFEPRYDSKLPRELDSVKAASTSAIEALKDQIYVRDVCVRCGQTIERGTS